MKLSIIGLGKLGAPMAAVMAHKGHSVIGVDLNPAYVAALQRGVPPVNETGLAEMIHGNRERLTATQDYAEAVLGSEITLIIVPTPSGPDGTFSTKYVLDAAEQIGAALRKKNEWHLVTLCATVMPGATGGELLPALEAHSGKKCGVDFGLCYNPEFIALGSVIHDMLNPDMILIGESDARSGGVLEKLYKGVCESNPRVQRMNFVNAEITKISVNTYVTTKISYANMLAEVCETVPGADVDVVTSAIGCDSRIGRRYLKGATGYGGPCFPRDNVAFSALARANGVPALLAEATDEINRRQVDRLEALVVSRLPHGGVAGVLGLSYKPETEVVEESQGMALALRLRKRGIRVSVFDPAAMENARAQLAGGDVAFAGSAKECAHQADVLAVMTPWSEFRALRGANMKPGSVLIDCWRLLAEDPPDGIAEYIALGVGHASTCPDATLQQKAQARAGGTPACPDATLQQSTLSRAEGTLACPDATLQQSALARAGGTLACPDATLQQKSQARAEGTLASSDATLQQSAQARAEGTVACHDPTLQQSALARAEGTVARPDATLQHKAQARADEVGHALACPDVTLQPSALSRAEGTDVGHALACPDTTLQHKALARAEGDR